MKRLLALSVLLILCCAREPEIFVRSEDPERATIATDAAFEAIVALLPAAKLAESTGNSRDVERISSAMEDLLLVFHDQSSANSMRKLVALSYFYLGEHYDEVYTCLVVQKDSAILPIIEQQFGAGPDPCIAEFGHESSYCTSSFRAGLAEERLRGFESLIRRQEPCEILR